MNLKKIGKIASSKVKDAAKVTVSVTKTASQKVGETAVSAAKGVKHVAGQTSSAISDGVKSLFSEPDREVRQQAEKSKRDESKPIPTPNALCIFYYLMCADGQITAEEEEKFDLLGAELDPSFAEHKSDSISVCQAQIDKSQDEDDRFDVLHEGVIKALSAAASSRDAHIIPRHLLLDLMAITYIDGQCNDKERRLMKAVVRELGIDRAVFIEMESSLLTLLDLEKETTWLKTTDRPYLVIEAMVNEIADRKGAIMQSVEALLTM